MSARRFKLYPSYKDSGVAWLGEVPAHWEVKPLKALLHRNDAGVWGEDFDDEGVIVLRSTEQTVDGSWKIDDPAKRKLSIREASAARLALDDLVVTKSSGSDLHIGKTSIVDERVAGLGCCFSNFMQRLRMAPPNTPRLYWRLLNCPVAREQLVFLSSTTTGLGNLNGSILGAVRVPVAPEPEQRAIAAFLDRETARIDALVAKKERLIELLQEQRTALIEAAVASAPASPETRLGYYVDLLPGYAFPSNEFSHDPDDVRLLRGVNISPDGIRWDDTVLWPLSESTRYANYQLREGDLVFGMDRPWITTGIRVAEVTGADIPSLLLQRVARLRARPGLSQRFLKLVLGSPQFQAYFEPILTGISVPHVSPEQILSFRIRLPTLEAQEAVSHRVEGELLHTRSMCDVLRESISRVNELRSAIISAAVTGKIDVRGASAEASASQGGTA